MGDDRQTGGKQSINNCKRKKIKKKKKLTTI